MVDARDMFINLRFQSITNLCLASVIITFQIVLLVTYPNDAYEKTGSGFWTGIILAFTGLVTWRSVENYRYSNASLVLSYVSVVCAIVLLGIYSGSIQRLKSCEPLSDESCYSVSSHMALNVFMVLFGVLGIFTNVLLAYSTRLFLGA